MRRWLRHAWCAGRGHQWQAAGTKWLWRCERCAAVQTWRHIVIWEPSEMRHR